MKKVFIIFAIIALIDIVSDPHREGYTVKRDENVYLIAAADTTVLPC